MGRMKRGMMIASTLMLVSLTLSACNKAYSQTTAATFTPVPQSNLFASPQANSMNDVATFAAGTANAQLTASPGAPVAITDTLAPGVTPPAVTATNTPSVSVNPTSTLAVPNVPNATPIPAGSRPATYTLHQGEFPWCIARRFDVDPVALLSLSGLSEGVVYPPGTSLQIPQTGSFPGARALGTHPTTYNVTSNETVYGVACTFGDIDPARIAQANNISVDAALSAGQTLSIP